MLQGGAAALARQFAVLIRPRAVARNPATPGDVLEQLVPSNAKSGNDQSLLLALAEHPASSAAVLASIARQLPPLLHERGAHPGFAAGIALS